MEENIYDIIAWGRVVTQGKEYILLSPKPYYSENSDGTVARSLWQPEGTLKWEVASADKVTVRNLGEVDENNETLLSKLYTRSIIIFGSDSLIEFYQDPKTIKVKYVTPLDDDQN